MQGVRRSRCRYGPEPNHPFAHLGRPIGVGGLAPQDAYNLLDEPLRALGYAPVESDVLTRAVTYANYHPAILQRFGHELVDLLRAEAPDGPPPWPVTHEHISRVFIVPEFAGWVAGLVDLTLQLDKRYSVIAYTMAMLEHEQDDVPVRMTVQDIMRRCEEYDAIEFNVTGREDEIVTLLDELVNLGVLRQGGGGRWQLRSRYVTRMLGSQDEILQRLVKATSAATRHASRRGRGCRCVQRGAGLAGRRLSSAAADPARRG